MLQPTLLKDDQWIVERPFTHPRYIEPHQKTLRYMAGQVAVLLAYPHLPADPPHTIHFNRPEKRDWFHRVVIASPDMLQEKLRLTIVGFFGQKRRGADHRPVHEFDRILIAEIPEHPGLLSYSSMALAHGNYGNLVVFANEEARINWSASRAHAEAVRQLSPDYYQHVTIYNGYLPGNINRHSDLTICRVKYHDYERRTPWQGLREILLEEDC